MKLPSIIVLFIILNSTSGDSQDCIPSEICQNTSLSKNVKSPNLRQEKLQKLTQIINRILMDEIEKDYNILLEDYKRNNKIKYSSINNCNSIEEIITVKDIIDGNIYMPGNNEYNEGLSKNSTVDLDKIIAKITEALEKFKDSNQNTEPLEHFSDSFELIPIFRLNKNGCKNNLKQESFQKVTDIKQAEINTLNNKAKFDIPCQRAADIFKETSTFVIPKCAYCDDIKHNFNPKNAKQISRDPSTQTSFLDKHIDSESSIAVLYKPKTVSMMRVFGNMLKKITTTILVPFHVIKLFDN